MAWRPSVPQLRWRHREEACIVAGFVLVLGLLIWAAVEDQRLWEVFAAEHNCRVVERARGSLTSVPVVASSGKTTLVTTQVVQQPDRTAYRCDDGVTYWR